MKKKGKCPQCHEYRDLRNDIESTFHKHFKYRDMPITLVGSFHNISNGFNIFLCKKCIKELMRAMNNGDNWE